MKSLVDLSVDYQRDISTSSVRRPVDYRGKNHHMLAPRFIFECAIKLKMKPLTSATAAVIFHRFFREVDATKYDEYLIATSCLYLAGKTKDDPMKIRDVINVAHNTLHRGSAPLELSDEYWAIRDAIVQAELLITRMLKFDLTVVHPHKYMLHYIKSLQEWFSPNVWNSLPIAKTAAASLQDFHFSPAILDFKPSHIAICCLSIAFQTYGVQVPLTDEFDESTIWYSVFCKDLTKDKHWEIVTKIIEIYNAEPEVDEQ